MTSKPYYEPIDIDKIDTIDMAFRPVNVGADFAFVTKCWIQDCKWRQRGNGWPEYDYIVSLDAHIKDLYAKGVNFILAYDPTMPENIFGFMVYEYVGNDILVIHFTYVKKVYRRMGICRILYEQINPKGIIPVILDSSVTIREIAKRHTFIFNPFILHKLFKREKK